MRRAVSAVAWGRCHLVCHLIMTAISPTAPSGGTAATPRRLKSAPYARIKDAYLSGAAVTSNEPMTLAPLDLTLSVGDAWASWPLGQIASVHASDLCRCAAYVLSCGLAGFGVPARDASVNSRA